MHWWCAPNAPLSPRALLCWLVLIATLCVSLAARGVRADPARVPVLGDCVKVGAAARAKSVPVLLVVSQDDCLYCQRLREEVIRPMIVSGEYRDRVVIRELNRDATEAVRDFDGRTVDARAFADRYQATLTPTVLFLNSRGRQLVPPIRGFNGAGLYGFYLDKAIARATARLRD